MTIDNSILIIGQANTDFKNKEIYTPTNLDNVIYYYGEDSQLTEAYKEAINIGATNISLCNCFKTTDYISVLNTLVTRQFFYICPLFLFSDYYKSSINSKIYYIEAYSNILSNTYSHLLVTDLHASLYESLEDYIDDMYNKHSAFKNDSFSKLLEGENLCFIANNLKDYKYANVVLASILSMADFKTYPSLDVGDVVYDINSLDFYNEEIAYFAFNDISKTTIDNFINYKYKTSPEKFMPLRLIKSIICKALDFDEFKGRLFTSYVQILIEKKLTSIMDSFVGILIESYTIKNIKYIKMEDFQMMINIDIAIKPYFYMESFEFNLEV